MTLDLAITLKLGAFSYDAKISARDEIVVLFGHSGAGKSVTLQAVAGLLRPESGRITVDGMPVFDSEGGINLPPQQRNVGYVVQDLALFPHMTVAQNVQFGIRPGVSRDERSRELLALLGLQGFEKRMPRTLSGGQQQRVALARALARDARLLLLDEPFSALDESLRSALRRELLRLRRELGLTIVFVTHDLREAHLLADRLAVFDQGRILQFGPRETVFRHPASRRVAELTGVANVLRGKVLAAEGETIRVAVAGLEFSCSRNGTPAVPGAEIDVAIRAERANLRRLPPDAESPNLFRARIVEEFAYGSSHTLHLEPLTTGPRIEVEIASRPYDVLGVAAQKEWTVELPPEDLHLMPVES